MARTCPKCGYERHPGEAAPETECPSCGVVYAKVEEALARQIQAGGPAAAEDAPAPVAEAEVAGAAPAAPEASLTDRLLAQKERELRDTRTVDLLFSATAALFCGFAVYFASWRALEPLLLYRGEVGESQDPLWTFLSLENIALWSGLLALAFWKPLYGMLRRRRASWKE